MSNVAHCSLPWMLAQSFLLKGIYFNDSRHFTQTSKQFGFLFPWPVVCLYCSSPGRSITSELIISTQSLGKALRSSPTMAQSVSLVPTKVDLVELMLVSRACRNNWMKNCLETHVCSFSFTKKFFQHDSAPSNSRGEKIKRLHETYSWTENTNTGLSRKSNPRLSEVKRAW